LWCIGKGSQFRIQDCGRIQTGSVSMSK
jgi:hypothetical protein